MPKELGEEGIEEDASQAFVFQQAPEAQNLTKLRGLGAARKSALKAHKRFLVCAALQLLFGIGAFKGLGLRVPG